MLLIGSATINQDGSTTWSIQCEPNKQTGELEFDMKVWHAFFHGVKWYADVCALLDNGFGIDQYNDIMKDILSEEMFKIQMQIQQVYHELAQIVRLIYENDANVEQKSRVEELIILRYDLECELQARIKNDHELEPVEFLHPPCKKLASLFSEDVDVWVGNEKNRLTQEKEKVQ